MLKSEVTSLSARLSQIEGSSSSELASLRDRLVEVEKDRDDLKGWKRRAEHFGIELEELRRRNEYRRQDSAEAGGEANAEELKKSLKRESVGIVLM